MRPSGQPSLSRHTANATNTFASTRPSLVLRVASQRVAQHLLAVTNLTGDTI